MKITFHSQETYEIKPTDIDVKIRAYLKIRQYELLKNRDNIIKFKDKKNSRDRSDFYTRIQEGEIEIIPEQGKSLLKLKFTIKIDYEFTGLYLLISGALFLATPYSLLLSISFLLNFVYSIFYLKCYFLDKIITNPRHPDNLLCY